MLKKTIKYSDLDGNPLEEDFYFHLSLAEVSKLELGTEGGLAAKLQKLVKATNGKEIIDQFEAIIMGSYGVRSDDNKRFIKSQEAKDAFYESDAYSELFMELISKPEASAEFVRGILPAGFEQEIEKLKTPQDTVQSNVFTDNPTEPAKALPYSAVDIMNMTPEEFANLKAQQQ